MLINDDVMEKIAALKDIAPLHNPVIVDSIRQTMRQFPEIPNVAVFDTVFHKTIPDYAYIYPLYMKKSFAGDFTKINVRFMKRHLFMTFHPKTEHRKNIHIL